MAVPPKHVVRIPGAGYAYDWRGTGLCPPAGGPQQVACMVEHIPVVPNVVGVADFHTLANVLRAQGLSLQTATDAEGNVAFYSNLDELCWQAMGLNQQSCGCEHMHVSTGEQWTDLQFKASAYLWYHAWKFQGIPMRKGKLFYGGPKVAKVVSPGHVAHSDVSKYAVGTPGRSDPGPGYDWAKVQSYAKYFKKHRTFKGA